MPLGKAHKARTREAILRAAAVLFRRHGYDGIGIDAIMAYAGLTRGAFYAHFPSKSALFAAVMGDQHELLVRLRARRTADAAGLRDEALRLLAFYLDPANRARIGEACSIASLPADTARAEAPVRAAFAEIFGALASEIERTGGTARPPSDEALLAVTLAVGALSFAQAMDGHALADRVERLALARLDRMLAPPVPA